MALPSSPPLLADDDDSDLPSAPSLLSLPTDSYHRKRQHSDYDSLSSDPLFSDTTEDDEVQDAERPRRKKLVRGRWWEVGKRSAHDFRRRMAKKESLRNADSGVFMGSDASEGSVDSILSSQQRLQELAVEDDVVEENAPVQAVLDAEAYAARIIQMCLDSGKEAIDLSSLALNHLSEATLRPLHQLIKSSFTTFTHPPSEDEFSPLTPSITLILSTNQLTSLPAELFNLSNLTCLSLRSNHLTHLPAAIARLTRLTEFNIAGNGIRYLPWELLDLIHCKGDHRQITARPNPLLQPTDLSGPSPLPRPNYTPAGSEDLSRFADTRETVEKMRVRYREEGCLNLRGELELRLKLGRMLRIQYLQDASRAGTELKLCREELIYLASSSIRYFGVDGTPLRRTHGFPPDTDNWPATMDPTAHAPTSPSTPNRTPSLFELALRSLQGTHNLTDFLHASPTTTATVYGFSPPLATAIHAAATNTAANHGNENCSTCSMHFIVARAEWVEYWFHGFPSQQELSGESVLPFLRRYKMGVSREEPPHVHKRHASGERITLSSPTTELLPA
ncbi:hypothetical protein B0A55_04005 [Friedmanniomyces simplex]|uniref:Uncharacterized protein n=1 Tax=Friedmanniomyces simplex TaxID=329884 RepID=A0A4U0XRV6_9PEZI|nr:hypothetical protein B0A55_04005 [Friedmanniomyces simplex]